MVYDELVLAVINFCSMNVKAYDIYISIIREELLSVSKDFVQFKLQNFAIQLALLAYFALYLCYSIVKTSQ